MSLLEQYEIDLVIETVIDLTHCIQREIHVFYDMCEMHQNIEQKS